MGRTIFSTGLNGRFLEPKKRVKSLRMKTF